MALDRLTQITSSGISSTSTITVSAIAGLLTATSATVGSVITMNSSGINAGVVTATNVNVGSAVTIHTGGFRVGSSDLHSTGVSLNNINASGVVTATSFVGNVTGNITGNLTGNVTGNVNSTGVSTFATANITQSNPTNLNVSGVSTFAGITTVTGTTLFAKQLNVSGVVTATSFVGDGTNLTNTGSTLSAASGSQRVVLTGQTSGTMTASATDSALTFSQSTGTLSATKFSGDGSALTGIAGTANVVTNSLVVSGVTTVAAGSSSIPSISPTGDSNTGIFFPSADTVSIGEGGVEALRINDRGQILLGVSGFAAATSPTASYTQYTPLHLIGGTGTNNGSSIFIARNTPSTNAANQDLGGIIWGTNDGAPFTRIASWADGTPSGSSYPGYLSFQTTASGGTTPTERVRIDSSGRLSINGAATQSAKLQVNHDTTDQYGIYVPGGIYAGSGFAGINYGGYFRSNTSNSGTTSAIGVYGTIANGPANTGYGGYFDGGSEASNQRIGVYGTARQSDVNGPAQQVGGWFNANTTGAGAGSLGSTIAVRAENASTLGSSSTGVRVTTVAGPTNVYGHVYEHAGSTVFRVKSNGGIDNFSANNTNLSDIREKKNIENLDSTWSCLKNWELKKFHYNEDADTDDKRYGVIAQQVAPHCPEVIDEWIKQAEEPAKLDEDGNEVEPAKEKITRMSVKEQQMYWMAIKALQEAQERIETLEAQNAAQASALEAQASALEALTTRLDVAGL